MTQQTSPAPDSALDKFFNALRGLGVRRRTEGKWLGGVCAGLADRLGVDPVIVRVVTVLLVAAGGIGLAAYLLAWLLLPNDRDELPLERALRHGHGGSVVLLVLTALVVFSGFPWLFGRGSFGSSFPWGLLVIGGLAWWLWAHRRTPLSTTGAGYPPPGSAMTPPGPGMPPGQPLQSPEGTQPGQAMQSGPAGHPGQTLAMQSGPATPTAPVAQPWSEGAGRTAHDPSAPWSASAVDVPVRPAPVAPFVPTPRRRSGGLLMTLVAVGLALVTYGVLSWLGDTVGYNGDHAVVATAGALAALGLVVLGLGIAGWRAGFVGFLAVCAVLFTAALSVVPTGVRVGGEVGDQIWQPVAVGSDTSFRLAAGDARLDLGALPTTGLTGQTIPVSIGAGTLTVVVPPDRTVAVRAHVGAGNITFPPGVGTGSPQKSGTDVSRQAVIGSGPAEVTVDARVGIGQITVVRE